MKTKLPLYTPSLLEPHVLEAIFVKRQGLLQDLLENHQQSISTNGKHFSLLIGPRGIGKTHLLSLFHHKVKSSPPLANNTVTAWLREEEWGIACYLDLLLQILGSIDVDTECLYLCEEQQAVIEAEDLLLEIVGDKTLLLISENMDLIFQGLGKDGQHQLRAFIQNSGKITIVAAAQSLFTGVTLRKSPFYGFFRIEHLQPLNVDEATELLVNIAKFDKKDDLVDMLQSSKGRVRVRALHHLANGNPRIYVTFSQLINAEALDQFTDAVLQMLDELTPYYQAKMLQIPPQQRKIVQFLCRQTGTTVVSDIAKFTHLKHQAASSQLKKLKDAGYVKSIAVGRTSHYEIAEPLMRLVLEVKETRRTPVKLMINFIRHWFSAFELKNLIALNQCQVFDKPWIGREFIEQALEQNKKEDFDPLFNSCVEDYIKILQQGDSEQLQPIVEDLAVLGQTPEDVEKLDVDKFNEAIRTKLLNMTDLLVGPVSFERLKYSCEELTTLQKHHSHKLVCFGSKFVYFAILANSLAFEEYQQLMEVFPWSCDHYSDPDVDYRIVEIVASSIRDEFEQKNHEHGAYLFIDFIRFCVRSNDSRLLLLFSKNEHAEHSMAYTGFYSMLSSAWALLNQQKEPLSELVSNVDDADLWDFYVFFINNVIKSNNSAEVNLSLFNEAKTICLREQLYKRLAETVTVYFGMGKFYQTLSYSEVINFSEHPEYLNELANKPVFLFNQMLRSAPSQYQSLIDLLWVKLGTDSLKRQFAASLALIFPLFLLANRNVLIDVCGAVITFYESLKGEEQQILEPIVSVFNVFMDSADKDNDESLLLSLPQEHRNLLKSFISGAQRK